MEKYPQSFEERWRKAGEYYDGAQRLFSVDDLEGSWEVQRLSGLVPMSGIYKVISGNRGRTGARWAPFGDVGFTLTQRGSSVVLVYNKPLSFMRDEFRREADGSWLGKARAAGVHYAWFRMVPHEEVGTRDSTRVGREARPGADGKRPLHYKPGR